MITPLLPGHAVYRGLFAMINSDPITGLSEMSTALGTGAALAFGVVLGQWIAIALRTKLTKHVPRVPGPDPVGRRSTHAAVDPCTVRQVQPDSATV